MMTSSIPGERIMRRAIVVALGTGAAITSAAAIGFGDSEAGPRAISLREYQSALRAVESARPHSLARCATLPSAEGEICRAEAEGAIDVRAAEVEAAYRRDRASARALQRARIDARYQVERARCAAQGGFQRDKCLVRAHANRGRAMLEAAAPYEVRFTP